ncbi:MAG: DNA mismatch repair endonuclease MutL [Spirochaetales bacterium]|nr:DNA mismatch repair endonuclease MutL [Spirochaetales bacterium]
MTDNIQSRRINILRDSVARRIAAGEVIDRPQAVVREILDNSIDADSTDISLYVEKGGMEEIRIIDNGSGMDAENLRKCFLPHATSKIHDFEDIYSTTTLGFRGEALSSIAACSKLRIISSTSDALPANKLEIYDGKLRDISEYQGGKGTVISVRDLFYSMPGRKNFLKSAGAESAQCRSMFIEKTLPQLSINFRYFNDGKLKLFLPASDLITRVHSAYSGLFQKEFIQSFSADDGGLRITCAAGSPSLYRKDRKYIQIFINNRRINDYSLVQAVDYAYSNYMPGGCHPVCFLFLQIPPQHIDFNIHPAKREVKFRNLPEIHHMVTETVSNHLGGRNSFRANARSIYSQPAFGFDSSASGAGGAPGPSPSSRVMPAGPRSIADKSIFRRESLSELSREIAAEPAPAAILEVRSRPDPAARLVYLGQLFKLFLVFEHDDELLIVDQHAAHERLIFNRLSNKHPEVQDLLVPLRFSIEKDEQAVLETQIDEYLKMGFELEKAGDCDWMLNAMPAVCSGIEDDIILFLRNKLTDAEELKKRLYAMISCRSAIKDGDRIDEISAIELTTEILELDNPRCPHGRPVIQLISRDELYRMFGRTF